MGVFRILATLLLTALAFDRWGVYNSPVPGLDGSWILAIHYVRALSLVHGTEYVFTYGPLGWLTTRLPLAVESWELVLFDVFWLGQVAGLIWVSLGKKANPATFLLLAFCLWVYRLYISPEVPFSLYFFSLVYLAYHHRTGNYWLLAGAIINSLLCFYTKANVGLISFASMLLYLVFGLVTGKLKPGLVVVVLSSMALSTFVTAHLLSVQLMPYLTAHWHLIESYNDVMYTLQTKRPIAVAAAFLLVSAGLYSIVCWRAYKEGRFRRLVREDGVLFLLVALPLFVLWKESFVRADNGHVMFFLKYSFLPCGLLVLVAADKLLRRVSVLLFGLNITLAFWVAPFHDYIHVLIYSIPQTISYIKDVVHPARPTMSPQLPVWPSHWLKQIGNKRVDIMPTNIDLLHVHNLRYAPRPVIQTYQVTDAYLDSLNATHFLSERAADFILFTWSSIDNRDPFADETFTKLALLQRYGVRERNGDWLLLERREQPLSLTLRSAQTVTLPLGAPIPVPADSTSLEWWQIQGAYTLHGALGRLPFQPPRLKLELTYESGEKKVFRTALPILKAGLLLPVHPRNLTEVEAYMRGGGQSGSRVRSIRLVDNQPYLAAFKDSVRLIRRQYQLTNYNSTKEQP